MPNNHNDIHVQLQLLRGGANNELQQYNLVRDPAAYHYTNQGSTEILSEKSDYRATTGGLQALGFSAEEISMVWRTVAAILHLGNIEFKSKHANELSHSLGEINKWNLCFLSTFQS